MAYRKLSCDDYEPPQHRKVRSCTAKEFTDWMIEHHGLHASSRETVQMNLADQFDYHYLWGELHWFRAPVDWFRSLFRKWRDWRPEQGN